MHWHLVPSFQNILLFELDNKKQTESTTVGTHYLDIVLFDFSLSWPISCGPEFIPSYFYINFVFISTDFIISI